MLTPKKILLSSILGIFVAFFIAYLYEGDICSSQIFCGENNEMVANFLLGFSFFTIIITTILIFHNNIFIFWWKFARIYIPVSAILTILSGSGRGGGYIGLTSDYESTAWFTAGLFFIISLILIIYKSFKLRGKHNQ